MPRPGLPPSRLEAQDPTGTGVHSPLAATRAAGGFPQGPVLRALESGPPPPAAPTAALSRASRPQPAARVLCPGDLSRCPLGCTPARWPAVSAARTRLVGLKPHPSPTPKGATLRAPVSSRLATWIRITVPWRVGCGAQALLRPSLENRFWQTPARPRWPSFPPRTRPLMSLPIAAACGPSVDALTKTLLKRIRLA